jgi:hypothetical protein
VITLLLGIVVTIIFRTRLFQKQYSQLQPLLFLKNNLSFIYLCNRKATGDYDAPGDVLKLLGGGGGLKILTKLINTIYETGEWP